MLVWGTRLFDVVLIFCAYLWADVREQVKNTSSGLMCQLKFIRSLPCIVPFGRRLCMEVGLIAADEGAV